MKFSQSSRSLLWAPVVAIALTSLSIGAGAKAEPAINSEAEQPIKRHSWLAIEKVGMAKSNATNVHRVTLLGSLPTPCHVLDWQIPSEASADGLLQIEAWSINSGLICVQALQPFHAELTFRDKFFKRVAVNGVVADEQTDLMEEALDIDHGPRIQWIRSSEPPTSTPDLLPVPGPLPLAGALAGWHSARQLRRRCKRL
jgi:hypothetical protein